MEHLLFTCGLRIIFAFEVKEKELISIPGPVRKLAIQQIYGKIVFVPQRYIMNSRFNFVDLQNYALKEAHGFGKLMMKLKDVIQ